MSDKPFDKLLDADILLQRTFRAGPDNAPSTRPVTIATIEVVGGFELFNTRPYHNYETWGQGYRVSSGGITVMAEDLDDAINQWVEKSIQNKRDEESTEA